MVTGRFTGLKGLQPWPISCLGLTAFAAICLTIGFRTRLSTCVSLLLVWSLHVSNPLVVTGGHILLRTMLFWSMFLPLADYYSIDNWLFRKSRNAQQAQPEYVSVACAAIMFQVALMYFCSGLAKLNHHWFFENAVASVLGMEMYVKPFGEMVRTQRWLLVIIGYLTLVFEVLGPMLMFAPRINKYVRGMCMAFFWAMHLGVWSTMSIGIFSLTAMASWLVFIPTDLWEREYEGGIAEVYLLRTPRQIWVSGIVLFSLAIVLGLHVINFRSNHSNQVSSGEWVRYLGRQMMLDQEFKLFGHPPELNPTIRYQAVLKDGTQTDIFKELNSIPGQPSDSTYEYFGSQHWRRIHSNLLGNRSKPTPQVVVDIRDRLLDRIVRRWNRTHASSRHVSSVKLACTYAPIPPSALEPTDEVWAVWNSGVETP